jgi:hypothetical protein
MKLPSLPLRSARAYSLASVCIVASLFLAVSLPEARSTVIGVNYNGAFHNYDPTNMATTNTVWFRGFIDYFAFKNGQRNLSTDPDILALEACHNAGYKSVVNIKFDYSNMAFPATQSGINSALSYLNTLLAAIYPYCDVIVGGNEPFIESQTYDRGTHLLNFYEAVANNIHTFEANQLRKAPLYVGAFNNLWNTSWQTTTTANLLAFVKANTWITGIDLHIHHTNASDVTGAFNYAAPKILSTQQIIVTEFSLVHLWNNHMSDLIPSQLATQYGVDPATQNCDFLTSAIASPVSLDEWICWLSNSSWYETNKNCITNDFDAFCTYPQFAMAMYAFWQNQGSFTCGTTPWELNPIFANQTVVPGSNGLPQGNYEMLNDFLALPH